MTLELEQEDAIGILKNLAVLPISNEVNVSEDNNNKLVCRKYHINIENSKFPNMDELTIKYKVSKYAEKIKDYSVYLTNSVGDIVYLCKYSPKILNTLFNNIIMLEMSNWRRVSKQLSPLRTIDDYKSLMFELDINNNKRKNHLLKKAMEKNTSKLLNLFKNYQDSNVIIPAEIWQTQIV